MVYQPSNKYLQKRAFLFSLIVTIGCCVLKQVTKEVIEAAHSIGLFVHVCVSDMGTANQDMWRTVGVYSGRTGCTNHIQHPCSDQHQLYFMADTPHLLKNVRNCLLNQSVLLPQHIVSSASLPSDCVTLSHVRELVKVQDDKQLKLVPNLTAAHVSPGQYQKMRVNTAAAVLSHTTASALQFCVAVNIMPKEAETTAWFIDCVNKWFDAMNARTIKASLFPTSQGKVNALHLLLDVIRNVRFTGRDSWKPIQTGIQLSTVTVLDLFNDLVCQGNYKFLITGRLTQDCVENFFSCIRGKGDSHPSPVHFRQNLRVVSLSQFMQITPLSSYDIDDSVYFLDFLKTKPVRTVQDVDDEFVFVDEHVSLLHTNLDILDTNVCYLLAGWTVHKQKARIAVICGSPCDAPAEAQLMMIKTYGGLSYPSELVYKAVQVAESVFRCHQGELALTSNVEHKLNSMFSNRFSVDGLPPCHSVLSDIISRYFRLRIHIHGKWITSQCKAAAAVQHGSRSAFCRTKVK